MTLTKTFIYQDTGVKKIMMLACGPIKETYENIKIMLEKISYGKWEFPFKFTADLSCVNKLCGLGNHRSMFPCYICLWREKDKFQKGAKKRTLKSLRGKKW